MTPDQNAFFCFRNRGAAAHSRPLPRRIKEIENPARSRNGRGITNQPAGRQERGQGHRRRLPGGDVAGGGGAIVVRCGGGGRAADGARQRAGGAGRGGL
jgi:hypothetical protein